MMDGQAQERSAGVPATEVRAVAAPRYTDEQKALVKRTVARGASDDELAMFFHVAERVGLDPFLRQIHAVKRWDGSVKREVMTIQVGIDGLRVVADRTGCYAPGPEPTFEVGDDGKLVAATAHVLKMTADGTWHDVAASVWWDEYAARTKDGQLTRFWREKGRVMLGKCAEAAALRRAFPQQTAGLYITEEMPPAATRPVQAVAPARAAELDAASEDAGDVITEAQRRKLFATWRKAKHGDDDARDWLRAVHGIESTRDLPRDRYDAVLARLSSSEPIGPEIVAAEKASAAADVVEGGDAVGAEVDREPGEDG